MDPCPACKSEEPPKIIVSEGMEQFRCISCGKYYTAVHENTDKNNTVALKFMQKHGDYIRQYIKQKELKDFEGDAVFCPVCSSSYRSFAPIYAWFHDKDQSKIADNHNAKPHCITLNKNARCPACGSLERQRLLWKYLREKTSIFDESEQRLLHFAPEEFFFNDFMNRNQISYFPVDLHPDNIKFSFAEGRIKPADITQLPFPDACFDVFLCSHVLEHVANDKLAMSELFRVTKKGGWGIVQVPVDYSRESTYEDFSITSEEGREIAFGQKDHVRWYGRDFIDRLAGAGFEVKEDKYVRSFSDDDIARYGLDPFEIIYFCRKP